MVEGVISVFISVGLLASSVISAIFAHYEFGMKKTFCKSTFVLAIVLTINFLALSFAWAMIALQHFNG